MEKQTEEVQPVAPAQYYTIKVFVGDGDLGLKTQARRKIRKFQLRHRSVLDAYKVCEELTNIPGVTKAEVLWVVPVGAWQGGKQIR